MNWRPVKNYEGFYEVSDTGVIRSLPRIIKGTLGGEYVTPIRQLAQCNVNGYKKVLLYMNGERRMFSVHRIVAEAFINNEASKPQVNHINGNKSDNRLINLEWATSKENVCHAHAIGLINKKSMTDKQKDQIRERKYKPVINRSTGLIHKCLSDAAKEAGISVSYLSGMLSGKLINRTPYERIPSTTPNS